jgi:hypothetical protein
MTHQKIGEEKKIIIIIMEHNHGFLKGKVHKKEKRNSKSGKNEFENFASSHHIFPLPHSHHHTFMSFALDYH